ncbi:glycoside hydrolase family 43 protein [Rugosimonospora acidiphila]|uniref:Glycoside hydrolase family 43 protein n=1 Tax=Rugosimonospora acidiphila TaxID=556531 RepID=A0ABP9RML4_9ACTN
MTTDVTASVSLIHNPVLPGFDPDPSILRVADDYYLATSTFEWYPGVRVHHSRDLVHWRTLGGILTERRLLDLSGAGDSCGIWAPDLSYVDGRFYLVFTDTASFESGYWDPRNYVVTAPDIAGPWSDPVPLHGHGFDPSFFHDEDGSTWMLSMSADWRPGRERFAGIEARRFDRAGMRLVGPVHRLFEGTSAGMTEGPRLYRGNGWYYLVTAEGGTSWEHQVTVARSSSLTGPYQVDPAGPLLTSRGRPDLSLQKAGHGSLVRTPAGEWYLAHLTARPYEPLGDCVLGRETAIQRVDWTEDGWPRVAGAVPAVRVAGPDLPAHPWPAEPEVDDFDSPQLGPQWSTLRRPASADWLTLAARPGHLRIHGGQSPVGRTRPSLVGRRVTAPRCALETVMEFEPAGFRQLAGVTAYYNTRNWHYAYVTLDDDGRRVLEVLSCDSGRRTGHPSARVELAGAGPVALRVEFDGPVVRFGYDRGAGWHDLPVELDATILSDEHAARVVRGEPEAWGFTGAFVGLWVQDLGADGGYADFDRVRFSTRPGDDGAVK